MYFKILSILFILAVGACAFGESHQRALLEWRRNEKIIEAGIRGDHSDTDEYLRSVIFFGELTGISIRGTTTTFGLLPNESTARDFAAVQEWCKKNCKNLYWDDGSQSVKIAK